MSWLFVSVLFAKHWKFFLASRDCSPSTNLEILLTFPLCLFHCICFLTDDCCLTNEMCPIPMNELSRGVSKRLEVSDNQTVCLACKLKQLDRDSWTVTSRVVYCRNWCIFNTLYYTVGNCCFQWKVQSTQWVSGLEYSWETWNFYTHIMMILSLWNSDFQKFPTISKCFQHIFII